MKEKQTVSVDYSKGIHRHLDSYLLGNNGLLYATKNMIIKNGIIERSPGVSNYVSGTVSGTPIHFQKMKFVSTYAGEYTWCITSKRLHQLNSTAWDQKGSGDFSPALSSAYRMSSTYFYTSSLKDIIVFTNKSDPVKKWNGTALADLGGLTNTNALTCATFMSHLLLGNTIESSVDSPWRVRWSSVGDPENFSTGTAGMVNLIDSDDFVVKLKGMFSKMFCYKERSIWELVYVGGSTVIRPVPLISNVGLSAADTVAEIYGVPGKEGYHVFAGTDNIYFFDGRSIVPIGDSIKYTIFGSSASVNINNLPVSQGLFERTSKIYYLAVPIDNSYPDTMYAYDMNTGTWWGPLQYGLPLRCFGRATLIGTLWSELTMSWSSISSTWMGLTTPTDVSLIGSSTDGAILKLDPTTYSIMGSLPEAYIETGDYVPGKDTRWLRVDVDLLGSTGATLYASTDGGSSWRTIGTRTGESYFKEVHWNNLNFTSDMCRFRLVLGSGTSKVRRMQIIFQRRMR